MLLGFSIGPRALQRAIFYEPRKEKITMKRKDCFFGLHFDYHANKDTKNIGKGFSPEVVERIVTEVQPDFIQCDTKGHPGYCSYSTKIGTPAPHLMMDLLAGWRKITKKHGVLLYSHYSGIWERCAAQQHPQWTSKGPNGEVSEKMSVCGSYAQELLIPQLKELARDYQMDGAWVDGECWAQELDYSPEVKALFATQTGKDPDKLTEDEKSLWVDFQRQAFFRYVENYIRQVKAEYPNFEITSNWLNSSWVPDNLQITDFISGDLAPTNSVDSARFDGRLMQSYGRNWDIMSWGISYPVHHVKSAVQLQQEAAVIMALGGGFQIYNMQDPQGTVKDEWAIPIWAEVSKYVRSRKAFCHNAKIKPDVGVLYSPKAYYSCMPQSLFWRDNTYNTELNGVLMALCDTGRSINILHTQTLEEQKLSQYQTIVITDYVKMETGVSEQLRVYVKNGGKLLIVGAQAAENLSQLFEIPMEKGAEQPVVVLRSQGAAVEMRCPYMRLQNTTGILKMDECEVEGDLNCHNPPPTIFVAGQIPSFAIYPFGQGSVGVIPVSFGRSYLQEMSWELKHFVMNCMDAMNVGRARVNKTGTVELLVTEKDNKTYVHLINLLGEHRTQTVKTFESIPAVTDVQVELPLTQTPKFVKLQPENREISYKRTQNGISIQLPGVELYTIIEIG